MLKERKGNFSFQKNHSAVKLGEIFQIWYITVCPKYIWSLKAGSVFVYPTEESRFNTDIYAEWYSCYM